MFALTEWITWHLIIQNKYKVLLLQLNSYKRPGVLWSHLVGFENQANIQYIVVISLFYTKGTRSIACSTIWDRGVIFEYIAVASIQVRITVTRNLWAQIQKLQGLWSSIYLDPGKFMIVITTCMITYGLKFKIIILYYWAIYPILFNHSI